MHDMESDREIRERDKKEVGGGGGREKANERASERASERHRESRRNGET
jgi:hypothetical protein